MLIGARLQWRPTADTISQRHPQSPQKGYVFVDQESTATFFLGLSWALGRPVGHCQGG